MRVEESRDGCVAIVDDTTNDTVVVEAIITAFVPARGSLRCDCGADSSRWDSSGEDGSTVLCGCCHRPVGTVAVAQRVYR
jgi:hypothetical protein